ncbi:MAG: hypothetical protein JNJ54_34095 [Myxococcaceae bacterium]|nr:hypothetical protein [Myxococcaceae bacterium]
MRRWLAVLGLGVVGCSHVAAVRERASFELGCDASQVLVDERDGALDASGCGRTASYSCETQRMESACRSAFGVPPAPADQDPPRGLTPSGAALNRAAIDLSCPEQQLKVVALSSSRRAFGVQGCGRRVTYLCSTFLWTWGCKADSAVHPW